MPHLFDACCYTSFWFSYKWLEVLAVSTTLCVGKCFDACYGCRCAVKYVFLWHFRSFLWCNTLCFTALKQMPPVNFCWAIGNKTNFLRKNWNTPFAFFFLSCRLVGIFLHVLCSLRLFTEGFHYLQIYDHCCTFFLNHNPSCFAFQYRLIWTAYHQVNVLCGSFKTARIKNCADMRSCHYFQKWDLSNIF